MSSIDTDGSSPGLGIDGHEGKQGDAPASNEQANDAIRDALNLLNNSGCEIYRDGFKLAGKRGSWTWVKP